MAKKPKKEKHPGGRPPIPIDEKLVRNLASIHCTNEEIAMICGVSVDTIERRFAAIIAASKAGTRAKLRRKQLEAAFKKDDWRAQKWLGQQMLGQKNQVEVDDGPKTEESFEVSFSWGDEK